MTLRDVPKRKLSTTLLCAVLAYACAFPPSADARQARDAAAFTVTTRMGRGVNILGYDGVWKGDFNNPFRKEDFKLIREAGFSHVRINFFGFRFMDAEDRLDPAVLARLDEVIVLAIRNGLTPVLDQHDNKLCQRTPPQCQPKLVAFWRQIATRYAGKHPSLIYEVLNEPGGSMSAALWNDTLGAALKAIRAVDPTRIIIAAALNVGRLGDVEKLVLPHDDRRLIVTVHYYEPFAFTHQGAPWSRDLKDTRDVDWGSDADKARVVEDFKAARDWAVSQGRPVYLGEFGVYDKAPAGARAAWSRHVAGTARKFGWSWAYWQFDHDFSLFDSRTHSWNRPLLDALMR